MTAHQLFQMAVAEVPKLMVGEKFIVRDLVLGYVWNREKTGVRLTAGTLFFNEVLSGTLIGAVRSLGKNSANQQRYEKI